eukprot:364280-Chlamydomonas_euryale.AAC.8
MHGRHSLALVMVGAALPAVQPVEAGGAVDPCPGLVRDCNATWVLGPASTAKTPRRTCSCIANAMSASTSAPWLWLWPVTAPAPALACPSPPPAAAAVPPPTSAGCTPAGCGCCSGCGGASSPPPPAAANSAGSTSSRPSVAASAIAAASSSESPAYGLAAPVTSAPAGGGAVYGWKPGPHIWVLPSTRSRRSHTTPDSR